MATVITQLVEQKVATDQRKAKMEAEMMAHMMQHMRMGKDSTAQCPMMKDMNAKKRYGGHAGYEARGRQVNGRAPSRNRTISGNGSTT